MTRVVIRVWAIPKNLNPVTVTEAPVVPVLKVARDVAADATKPVAWKRRSGKKTPGHPHRRVASQMTKAETESETATIATAMTVTVIELAIVGAKTKTVTNDGTPQNTKHDVRHETVEHEALKRAPLPRTDAPPFVAVL